MKKYVPLVGLVSFLILMIGMPETGASVSVEVTQAGPRLIGMEPLNLEEPLAPGALTNNHDKKNGNSDSKAKADYRPAEKPDLRTVDWNKGKNGAQKMAAAKGDVNGNSDKEEEEEENGGEEEKEEESEGFDRLWDVSTLG